MRVQEMLVRLMQLLHFFVPTEPDLANDFSEQINSAIVGLQVAENASGSETNVDDQHTLSVEDVDSLLDTCFLQALHHTTVKDKDLHMLGSILWQERQTPWYLFIAGSFILKLKYTGLVMCYLAGLLV